MVTGKDALCPGHQAGEKMSLCLEYLNTNSWCAERDELGFSIKYFNSFINSNILSENRANRYSVPILGG